MTLYPSSSANLVEPYSLYSFHIVRLFLFLTAGGATPFLSFHYFSNFSSSWWERSFQAELIVWKEIWLSHFCQIGLFDKVWYRNSKKNLINFWNALMLVHVEAVVSLAVLSLQEFWLTSSRVRSGGVLCAWVSSKSTDWG